MKLRKITSLTTLLSFILLLATSIILYITPQGKIAFWANWKIGGLGKEQWGALHTNLGFLFIIAGLIHTILNWGPIVAYMKNKAKKLKVFTADFNVALIITLVIAGFTLFEIPPINAVQTFNESLKEAAAEEYGEPPYGHAEASPLKTFCQRTGLDLKDALKKLEKAKLQSVSATATLAEISKANAMTPQQVYMIIKPAPVKGKVKEMAMSPGMGFGRKTLESVCSEFGLDAQSISDGLKGLGIEASSGESMKEIAEKSDTDPHAIYEAIRQLQE
ncbi:DUF4405 domain-containing protein [Pontiella sulfatireligans]|uniref:Flavinylation-associated cytochrome domain-containing protein n=1 Tax=Pontiella sulfatireligans TaxID=2750658 RepID=A0A6C2UQ77_9BACT|nr:DUF4405 domain-containing protein [Pontiella sulfatireligans]VGO22229.1 hypothetical protein SCARR_04311 [Pontiella sulfatireligans]